MHGWREMGRVWRSSDVDGFLVFSVLEGIC